MQVKNIAECSCGALWNTFTCTTTTYHLSLIPLFCLFLSGRLRQVSLYSWPFVSFVVRQLLLSLRKRKGCLLCLLYSCIIYILCVSLFVCVLVSLPFGAICWSVDWLCRFRLMFTWIFGKMLSLTQIREQLSEKKSLWLLSILLQQISFSIDFCGFGKLW